MSIVNTLNIPAISLQAESVKPKDAIINELKSDISRRLNALPKIYTGNIIGDFDKNSVFTEGNNFSFKDLRYGCKGHVYSDIANIALYYGLSKPVEKTLLQKITQKMSLTVDNNLYNQFYELELRRKALHYLLQYLNPLGSKLLSI